MIDERRMSIMNEVHDIIKYNRRAVAYSRHFVNLLLSMGGIEDVMACENVFLTETDRYMFGKGTHYEIYEKLGAHCTECDGKKGVYFAVWAPAAVSVQVIGDFNDWDGSGYEMERLGTSGIFQLFTDKADIGSIYKYLITGQDGRRHYKADPYGNYSQLRPETASVVTSLEGFEWQDDKWLMLQEEADHEKQPMAIYEVHPGSWKKKDDGTEDGFLTYRELADQLADYVTDMGYTHVELMGIAEYPYDGSWGYQVTGYYAPTSRYGTPKDFMYFVNKMHKKGIGVILDWVPAHFPRDAHGLSEFDGSCVYEYADRRKGEHPEWGTKIFDYGKTEVSNFLIANALFWVEKFHVDGLRVDAVASMLYLDYGKTPGNWVPNKYGGNGNLEAMEFFKHLNSIMKQRNRRAIVIAEESTAWPGVTKPAEEEGLGFSFKWNMGWMHDFLEYMKLDPYFRKYNHNKMTFGMLYAYSENFVLVLSHDEVVHLKCSMLEKMPGEYQDKFANLKVAYTFFMGHPGKKLLFMGQDFAQWSEWSEARSLDWHLMDEPEHREVWEYFKALLHIYRKYPACYELDQYPEGFRWINPNDGDRSIFSFMRRAADGKDNLLFVCNFTPVERPDYMVGVPQAGNYTLILDNEMKGSAAYRAVHTECDEQPYALRFPLPAYGTAVFRFSDAKKKPVKKNKSSKNVHRK